MAITIGVHVARDHLDALAMNVDDGAVVAEARADYRGEPDDLARACDEALAALSLGARRRQVASIGLSGAPAGAMVDADGAVVSSHASSWSALRSADAEAWSRATTLLTSKDAVGLHLCGERGSDDTSALAMGLYDGAARRWSSAALDAARIPHQRMPPVGAPVERLGRLPVERAARVGLAAGTPVMRGATAGVARAIAAGAVEPGRGLLITGDDAGLFATTPAWIERPDDGVRAMRHGSPRQAAVERSFACPSRALGWYERTLCDGERLAADLRGSELLDLLCEAATTAPPGAGGMLFVVDSRCALVGAGAHSDKAEVSRAVLEGVAHALADAIAPLAALVATAGAPLGELRVCGPLGRRALIRQLLADVTALEVCTTTGPDTPAYGAALIAACGMAEGDLRVVDSWVGVRHRTRPNPATRDKQAEVYRAHRALRDALKPQAAALERIDLR